MRFLERRHVKGLIWHTSWDTEGQQRTTEVRKAKNETDKKRNVELNFWDSTVGLNLFHKVRIHHKHLCICLSRRIVFQMFV